MTILDAFKLNGKVALVTGANRGLGQAISVALAEAGAGVVGLSRSSNSDSTRDLVSAQQVPYHHLALDLSTAAAADLASAVEQAIALTGRLDILVNNAGIIRRNPAVDYLESDWNDVIQVNLKAAFLLAQCAARHMLKNGGGKVINIASLLSYQGGIFVPAYAAAKHGIMGLTRALSNEWAPQGINVNAIAPGYFETDNTAALRADADRSESILKRIPAGRWGKPDDLKGAAVFLASEAASYMHGETIAIDGGWLAR